jgi:hypothetical protein
MRKNTDYVGFLILACLSTIIKSVFIFVVRGISSDKPVYKLAFGVLIVIGVYESGRAFRVRSRLSFDCKIYCVWCRGKTFIFIFFFNILICN